MKNLKAVQVGEVYSIPAGDDSMPHTFICYDYQGGLTVHVGFTDRPGFPIMDISEFPSVYKDILDERDGGTIINFIRESKGLTTLQDFNIQDENYALLTKMYNELIEKIKIRHSWEEVMS
jgi:hypothetical protein